MSNNNFDPEEQELPEIGRVYKHFKNNLYIVESVGRDVNTAELFVVYVKAIEALNPNAIRHLRSVSDWNEIVDKPEYGYKGKRFTRTHIKADYSLMQHLSKSEIEIQ